jgi:hypothetical protein
MEPPEIKKLDFSEFHPLDHSLWECRDYPGGRRTHLEYRWQFQWKDKLHELTLCRVGRHKWTEWYGPGKQSGVCCQSCYKDEDLGVQKMAEVSSTRIANALERIADVLEHFEVQQMGTVDLDGQQVTPAEFRTVQRARESAHRARPHPRPDTT